MDRKIFLSILTVVRNDEKNIEKTIQSVISQKEDTDEYFVVDGSSTDNTQAIIKKYISHINKFISEPDKNLYDALNKGIK
jgi:glycosyltransferase involved in cell wall biosynthesis